MPAILRTCPPAGPDPGPARRRLFVGAGTAVALVLSGVAVAPVGAAVTGPIDCPAPLPTTSAVEGLKGTGFTVERGTTPGSFTASVLGRVVNGIRPGTDMIMAELDSPALQRAGGVWEGMSGSPVYTDDGRLIGAVSHSLSGGPSRIAGITPAQEVMALVSRPAGAPAGSASANRAKVSVPSAAARRLVATGAATAAETAGGFRPLAVPLWVTGATGPRAAELLKRLQQRMSGARVLVGGAPAPMAMGNPSQITAGSNFAVTLYYGDATVGGIGTTTVVCDGIAVALGHSYLSSGPARMTAHTASSVYVQENSNGTPSKVANITSPVGNVQGDYLTGVRARLGTLPNAAGIRSSLARPGGPAVTGTSLVTTMSYAPDAANSHALLNVQKVLNADSPGSATVTIAVRGVRAGGSTFTVTRTDTYSSAYSIASTVGDQVYTMLSDLLTQSFERVQITGVTVTGTVRPTVREYRVTALKVRQGTTSVPVPDTIRVAPGSRVTLLATLTPFQGVGRARTVTLSLPVAAGTSGRSGALEVLSGNSESVPEARSFDDVLRRWRAVGLNDRLIAKLDLGAGAQARTGATIAGVVSSYSRTIAVEVR